MQQSPVNITGYTFVGVPELHFRYRGVADRITNTGDFVRVKYEDGGGILLDGRDYRLMECHAHYPGEHTVEGERFALETHLVHVEKHGEIAVVGILYRLGESNTAIQDIIDSAPNQGADDTKPSSPLRAVDFLPEGYGYYTYIGSLTTAPYTEGVKWFVLSEVLEVSEEQVRALTAATGGGTNNRALQPINGRVITVYEGNERQRQNGNLTTNGNQTGS